MTIELVLASLAFMAMIIAWAALPLRSRRQAETEQ